MEEPGGESTPSPHTHTLSFVYLQLFQCRCFTFGSWLRSNSSSHSTWNLFSLSLNPACLVRVLQVRMVVAVRAAEHQSGTRSTPRCSRTPGTTPASSKWTRLFASGGCALCRDELGFEWVECVVFHAQGNSATWARLSWQHASLNSPRVTNPEASVLWPKHWAQIWGGLFLLPLVFVSCTKRATTGIISARTLTQTRSRAPTCVREVVSPAPRTLPGLCASALDGEEVLMISSSQVSAPTWCDITVWDSEPVTGWRTVHATDITHTS